MAVPLDWAVRVQRSHVTDGSGSGVTERQASVNYSPILQGTDEEALGRTSDRAANGDGDAGHRLVFL